MDINYDLVVENGRVYTSKGLKSIDLWIKDGKIHALGGPHHAHEKINAHGMIILPGAIDAHVHFRDPGQNYKEDWESGSTSAAAGGVTTVIDQPNTDPRTLDVRSFQLKLDLAKRHSVVDFCLNGGPGKIEELAKVGASAIGEIFAYEHNDIELMRILEETRKAGILTTIHAEDGEIIKEKTEPLRHLHANEIYSQSRPAIAEARAIEKVLEWSELIHICHLSTRLGLELIKNAKKIGKKVTCEVTPHHLLLNVKDYCNQGSNLKMHPPLRFQEDNDALWAGIRDGSVDILASDHAPHLPEEKNDDIWDAPPGVPGTETMLPLMLFAVRRNLISINKLIDAIADRPAKIFGLKSKGVIDVGKDADLVIVDPKAISKISADRLHSRSEWTPYEGKDAIFPKRTIVRGTIVFEEDIEVAPGYGKFQGIQRILRE